MTLQAPLLPLMCALRERREQDCSTILQELERRLRPLALAIMRRMVHGQLAEEDGIFNNVLSSIVTASERFRGRTEEEAVSYCRQVVTRKTLDHIRRESGKLLYVGGGSSRVSGYQKDSDEKAAGREKTSEIADPDERSNPETLVLDEETTRLVRKALDCLTPLERELIERVEFRGERITDIANATRVKENTLTKRKNRAKLKIKKFLLARWPGMSARKKDEQL